MPRARPTPSTAPTSVCVVEMGRPVPDASTTVPAAASLETLLVRMLDPPAGSVLVDGHDIVLRADGREHLVGAHHVRAIPGAAGVEGHELDKAEFEVALTSKKGQGDDVVFGLPTGDLEIPTDPGPLYNLWLHWRTERCNV